MNQGLNPVCALPGCDEIVEQPGNAPPREYCHPAHRTEARQLRVTSGAGIPAPSMPGSGSGGVAVSVKPRSWERMLVEQQFAPASGLELDDRPPAGLAYEGHHGVLVLPTSGDWGVVRHPMRDRAARLRDVHWVVAARRNHAASRDQRHGERRRQALAVLSAFGILSGGGVGGWLSERGTVAYEATGPSTAHGAPHDDWATRAQVTLNSLDHQLARIATAEKAWRGLPASRRQGAPPVEVSELLRRKSELEHQRALVAGAMSTYQPGSATGAPLLPLDTGDRTTSVADSVLNLVRSTPMGKNAHRKTTRSHAHRSSGATSLVGLADAPVAGIGKSRLLGRAVDLTGGLGLGDSPRHASTHRGTSALDDLGSAPIATAAELISMSRSSMSRSSGHGEHRQRIAEWAKREVASIERALDASRRHSSSADTHHWDSADLDDLLDF